jgi:hypothetical protein
MRNSAIQGAGWALAVGLLAVAGATAKEPKGKDGLKYIRVERDAERAPLALQTSIVEFVPQDGGGAGLQVDLVGAVHVGERTYYEELNRLFETYDVVLYELVAPPGTRVPKGGGGGSGHPVSLLQNGLKEMLGLDHQMQVVDYTRQNLVHADMSPEQFSKSMADRNESFWSLFFRMMGQGIAQQAKQQAEGKSTDFDLLMALFDKNRSLALKRVMAEQFEEMDGMLEALDGPMGSTIITERNKVALEGLRAQIKAGKKRIAVFYGAGHLADMERRLAADFQLKRKGERWLSAWNLRGQKAGK